MAYDEAVRSVTMTAGSAIDPYRFINIAADGEVDYAATAQGRVDGVSLEKASGQGKTLAMGLPDGSIVKVLAGGTFSRGDRISTSNAGKAVVLGSANGDLCWGVALEDGVDGRIVSIQFAPKGQVNA